MSCPYPGGLGPWTVAFCVNTASKSKKRTHIVAHTYPQICLDVLNRPRKPPGSEQDQWVILMKVGPFDCWSKCVAYAAHWDGNMRGGGVAKKKDRGLRLFEMCHKENGTVLWLQTRAKQDLPPLPFNRQGRKRRVVMETEEMTTDRLGADNSNHFFPLSKVGHIKRLCIEAAK